MVILKGLWQPALLETRPLFVFNLCVERMRIDVQFQAVTRH